MDSRPSARIVSGLQAFTNAASLLTMGIGLAVLVGWLFDIAVLKSILPRLSSMKANTAIAFTLSGFALWLARDEQAGARRVRLQQACSGLVLLLALLTLGEHAFGLDFHIDQFLFRDSGSSLSAYPGRMSIPSALALSLIGIALLLLDVETQRGFRPAQSLGLAAGSIALLALIGFVYDVQALYRVVGSMALHSALAALLLALGILTARPGRGWMKVIITETIGGVVLRRTIPLVVGIPLMLSVVIYWGQRAGYYDPSFGLAMIVVLVIAIEGVTLWTNAEGLNRLDTRHKQAEEQIRDQAYLLDHVKDAIVASDANYVLQAWNQGAEQMYGWQAEEVLGRSGTEILQTEFPKAEAAEMRRQIAETGFYFGEATQLRKDGVRIPVEIASMVLRDPDGKISGYVSVNRDITQRKLAEQALRESERKFSMLFEKAPFAVSLSRPPDGRIQEVNAEFEHLLGYSRQEAIGKTSLELGLYPDPGARQRAATGVKQRGFGHSVETQLRTKSGELRDFLANSDFIDVGNEKLIITTAQDITERKQAEAALAASENLFKTAFDHSPLGMCLTGLDGRLMQVNQALADMLGFTQEELVGAQVKDFTHPDDQAASREAIRKMISADVSSVSFEKRYLHKSGSLIWVQVSSTLLRDAAGEPLHFVTQILNTTERRQGEEKFRLVVESAPNAILLVNGEGLIEMVNAQTERFFGYARLELLGLSVDKLVPEPYRPIHLSHRQSFFADPDTRPMGAGRDLYGLRKDGTEFPVEIGLTPLVTQDGRLVMATIVDITERKQAEEQFRLAVESAPNAIVLANPAGRISLVNSQAETFFGYGHAEMTGLTVDQLVPVRFRAGHAAYRAGFIRDLQVRPMGAGRDLYGLRKDGSEFPIEIGLTPLDTREGQLVMATIVDITERKAAEARLQWQYQRLTVLREIDTAILAADSVESIVDAALSHIRELIGCRRAHMSIFDWGASEAVIYSVRASNEAFIPKGTRVPLRSAPELVEALSKNQPIVIDDLSTLPNPSPLFQAILQEGLRSVCILPLFSQGSLTGTFNLSSETPGFFDQEKIDLGREVANQVAIAITQNSLLTELRSLNADLERRVQERTLQLEATNQELESFSYSVSHDLRAPLRAINGFSQALTSRYKDALGEQGQHYLSRIQKNTSQMGQLIDDLLALSRIARREMKQDTVQLTELAREVDRELRALEPERHVVFEVEGQMAARGDAGLIRIVLQNLLANAWKFTGTRPQAYIQFGVRPIQGKKEVFFVQDNGVGFDMIYVNKLFGAFQRLHSMAEFPGTGIGLATVERIIHRHGGEVWAEAEPEKGATFYFTLGDHHEG